MAPWRTLSARRLHRNGHEPPGRARCCLFAATAGLASNGSRKAKARPSDAAVVLEFAANAVRLQLRALAYNLAISCAPWRDAGADQSPAADELEGIPDQDRREGRVPRALCRLPCGRGCHPRQFVPGDFAAHRGTAATAATRAGVRRSMVMRSRATDGRSVPICQGKRPDQALNATRRACDAEIQTTSPSRLPASSEDACYPRQFAGSSGEFQLNEYFGFSSGTKRVRLDRHPGGSVII